MNFVHLLLHSRTDTRVKRTLGLESESVFIPYLSLPQLLIEHLADSASITMTW